MQIWITVLAVLSLLAPQGPGTEASEVPAWAAVAEQVRTADSEARTEQAARALMDWAQTGQTVSAPEVEALLDTWQDDPVETARRYAAVLDAAEELVDAGAAEEETYLAAARAFSPFFTRLLEEETTPWRQEASAWPADLADFDGIWCDSTVGELLIFRAGRCRVVIPFLDCYGETAYGARLRDRSEVGYCPSLEVDIHDTGTFQGPLAYYVSGLAADHFWCNTQSQRFDRLAPGL